MHLTYFGDSYDIVKQALINWLRPFGDWSAHPMFTGGFSSAEAEAFSRFLNASLISTEILGATTDRARYFEGCHRAHNLFLDPDTGPNLPKRSTNYKKYLFPSELIPIVLSRPESLTMVFDQSFVRGPEPVQVQVQQKLQHLASSGVSGFAYTSHASFLVLASDRELLARAHEAILREARLPATRFIHMSDD